MKTTLFMAVSADGYVARSNGSEDFLPDEGWDNLFEFIKTYGHVIWGRNTYEYVRKMKDDKADFDKIPIIIVSNHRNSTDSKNVIVCSSPEKALKAISKLGFDHAFLSGGPTLNTLFVKAGLVDEIVLNYNPTILFDGIKLFNEAEFEVKLELEEIKKITKDIFQVKYNVI